MSHAGQPRRDPASGRPRPPQHADPHPESFAQPAPVRTSQSWRTRAGAKPESFAEASVNQRHTLVRAFADVRFAHSTPRQSAARLDHALTTPRSDLREHARAMGTRPEARAALPEHLSNRRGARFVATAVAGGVPRGRARGVRVVPIGRGASRVRALRRAGARDHTFRAPAFGNCGRIDPRERGVRPDASVEDRWNTGDFSGAHALRPHGDRSTVDGGASGRRGVAAEVGDPREARPDRGGSGGAWSAQMHGDARDPRAPSAGLPPGRQRPGEAHRRLARARRPSRTDEAPSCASPREELPHRPLLPQQRIAIEYDSWGFHNGRQAFDDDRARGNDLVLLGFDVLRFTSRSGDQSIVDTVAAALRRTSAS